MNQESKMVNDIKIENLKFLYSKWPVNLKNTAINNIIISNKVSFLQKRF